MKYSKLFGKTNKMKPADADSANARLLLQAGFVNQLAAGIFTYLPLGLRVLKKIKKIVREEMNIIDGQEILMPALTPKDIWDQTGRWDKIDVLFKLEGAGGKEYALGSTHEEVVTPLVKQYVKSYRDLPLAVYQIQDKFRNEPRAKSGLLRGREFLMKDLYSFHLSTEDFEDYYEKSKQAYLNVFNRCGLDAIIVAASGGDFSKHSHEFQVLTESGEDHVYHCDCGWAENKEIVSVKEGGSCPECGKGQVKVDKAIEVGNIFPLKDRFTSAFDFKVQGPDGQPVEVIMGCYGIGPSRVMGSVVEVHHDDRGIIWPKSIAPYQVEIVTVNSKDEQVQKQVIDTATKVHDELEAVQIEVLWDDRDVSPGEKFADADLIGIPLRLVISEKTLAQDSVEVKERASDQTSLVKLDKIKNEVCESYS
ncbi:MAG: aminoacyl--tRNA ligase-related protein [Candidatus Uhrbacteria bacterium]